MLTRRSWFVHGSLLAIWVVLIGWQTAEHLRVRQTARNELRHRADVIYETVGTIMRYRPRFGYVVPKEQLEDALNDLAKDGEFLSLELLNATNGTLAFAGQRVSPTRKERLLQPQGDEDWDERTRTVALFEKVDLGTNSPIIIFDPAERDRPGRLNTNATPGATSAGGSAPGERTNELVITSPAGDPPPRPVEISRVADPPPGVPPNAMAATNSTTNAVEAPRGARGGRGGRLLSPEVIQTRGVYHFIIIMSTDELLAKVTSDFWQRTFIAILASISVVGFWIAWGNITKTSELQIRLVRTSELNTHLKEMNIAAAGLAHETRNPLNIVRGLAQMISKSESAAPEIRSKSRDIIDETDRITAQLNEFINYSRPREVRRAAVNLNTLVSDIVRAVNYDIEEKKVQLQVLVDPLTIEADEQLLRQTLFNLVLNAIQAVPVNGTIWIRGGKRNGAGAFLEVADDGPGIAAEHRAEIFKPYFTMQAEGTGLGLAVVQQNVLAHGWEIECLPNQPGGAIFRITHIKGY